MKKFLCYIDTMSYQPGFHSKEEIRFKTPYGGLTLLLLIVLNFAGIIYFAKDIYLRQNPSVLQYDSIENDPPAKNITVKDFSFVLALANPITYQAYSNSSVYDVEFYNYKLKNDMLVDSRKLKSGPCTRQNFEGVNMSIFSGNFPFQNYHCIDPSEVIELKGVLSGSDISYINIKIKKCQENCVSEEEFSKLLDGAGVYFYYVDKYFDPSNYEEPTKYYFNQYFNSADQHLFKGLDVTIKHFNFIDDIGILFEHKQVSTELVVDQLNLNIDQRSVGDFFEIIIHFSQKVTNLSRNYIRLQQVVANVGGLLNSVYIISQTIVNLLTRELYYSYCRDKIFKINKKLEKKHANNESTKEYVDNENDSNPNILTNMRIPKNNFLEIDGMRNETHSKLKNKESFSKIKEQMIKTFLKRSFDYENFIKFFKEIESLKNILFSPKQKKIFNRFISSPESSILLLQAHTKNKILVNFLGPQPENLNEENDLIEQRLKNLIDSVVV